MSTRQGRLDKLYPALTAKERAVLVLRRQIGMPKHVEMAEALLGEL